MASDISDEWRRVDSVIENHQSDTDSFIFKHRTTLKILLMSCGVDWDDARLSMLEWYDWNFFSILNIFYHIVQPLGKVLLCWHKFMMPHYAPHTSLTNDNTLTKQCYTRQVNLMMTRNSTAPSVYLLCFSKILEKLLLQKLLDSLILNAQFGFRVKFLPPTVTQSNRQH